ncbi:MAG TPA: response regulator [Pyrinomonadaceae bacterium]|nr:response regulator [Pyrinomonadaceae bacterium]
MRTILVVEDYDDVRQMLRILLESEEFRVVEAASGAQALDVLKRERPDAILMDLALPGFDGLEAIRRIRAIDRFRNTPIVVLTAYTGPSTYETAIRAGSDYFMAKPIDFDELAALLNEVLFSANRKNSKFNRASNQRAMLAEKRVPPRPARELRYSV